MVISANVLQAQIEKVRPKVEELFETSDNIAALIKKGGEAEVVSEKLYRIPLVTSRGGAFRAFNADGGDMGPGTGLNVTNLEAGFFYSDMVYQLSLRTLDDTAKSEQAVINAFSYNFKNAMKELQAHDDIVFHTNGNGVLTNSSSAISTWNGGAGSTITFASASDYVDVRRLRPGMNVDIYNSSFTTNRGNATIDHVDYINKVAYFTSVVPGLTSGDVVAIAGLTPTLQSFQSSWPLSGDSFRHGLYYFLDNNTSNYCLGQLKSNVTELLANSVNVNGQVAHVHGLILQDQIIRRRDQDVYKGLVGIAPMAQRTAIYNIGIAMSEWFRGKSDKMIDVMPGGVMYDDTFPFVGLTCKLDKRQDSSRIDFIIPKKWGRAMLHDTKFHEVQGRTVYEGRTSSGTIQASVQFILVQVFDYYVVDPGAQGYLYNLTVPQGY